MFDFKTAIRNPDYLRLTISILSAMADDPIYKPGLLDWLREGINQRDGRYELRTALNCLAANLRPKRYLEIGVRTGWSLAQVCHQCPTVDVLACDTWIENYGGAPNPGPDFVLEEIRKTTPNFHGHIDFISASSRELALGCDYDLITIDGSHTYDNVLADIRLCLPHLAPGGFLLMDDLLDTSEGGNGTLRDVWELAQAEFPNFEYIENSQSITPLGIVHRAHRPEED